MAVYLRIIGIRKLDSIESEINRLENILPKVEMNIDFLKQAGIIAKEIGTWELKITEYHKYFEYKTGNHSFKVTFDSPDFLEFLCSHGGNYYHFVDEKNNAYANGVLKIFRSISILYELNELTFFSEWFFDPDEIRIGDSTFKELKKMMELNPKYRRTELWGLESNEYYVEKINPIANNVYN